MQKQFSDFFKFVHLKNFHCRFLGPKDFCIPDSDTLTSNTRKPVRLIFNPKSFAVREAETFGGVCGERVFGNLGDLRPPDICIHLDA